MKTPEVTIAIPTYNRADLLPRALESALSQTYKDIEVVVCDDGSTDTTQASLANYRDDRLRVISQPRNVGMFENMNTCLGSARGAYYLMLSDDDFLEPICLEALLQPWCKYEGLSMVYGQWWYHSSNGRELQVSAGPEVESGFSYISGYWQGKRPTILHGVLFRTEDIRRVGGIQSGDAQDTMLTLRMAYEGHVAHVRKTVTNYCLQPGSNTHRVGLFTSIRDMDSLLEMCVSVGREKRVPGAALCELERRVYRNLSKGAAAGIVSLVGRGSPRTLALREAYRLRKYLAHKLGLGILAVCVVACVPRGLINILRWTRKRLSILSTERQYGFQD